MSRSAPIPSFRTKYKPRRGGSAVSYRQHHFVKGTIVGPATLTVLLIVAVLAAFGIILVRSGVRRSMARQICPAPGCGRLNAPGAGFCAHCGHSLDDDHGPREKE